MLYSPPGGGQSYSLFLWIIAYILVPVNRGRAGRNILSRKAIKHKKVGIMIGSSPGNEKQFYDFSNFFNGEQGYFFPDFLYYKKRAGFSIYFILDRKHTLKRALSSHL